MAHLTANYLNEDIASESNLRDKTTIAKKRSKIASNDDLEEDLSKIDLKDELNCPVCRELCKVPPRECLLCGHLFCYECIANLKSCPLCRNEPFDYRESCFASRLLNNIHVKCGSCDSMVIRSQLETHMAAMCEARLRQCSFPECTFAANNVLELTDHIKNQHQSDAVVSAGGAAADANVSQLRLCTRISTLKDIFQADLSICALSGDVLLAAGMNSQCEYDKLRAISLPGGRLCPNNNCSVEEVRLVAFDQRTDTLLIITGANDEEDESSFECLMSLKRIANKWIEVQRLRSEVQRTDTPDFVVCESRVLLGPVSENCRGLYSYDVSAEHQLRAHGSVAVENEFYRLASTRLGDDTVVACSHSNSVSLHRLVEVEGALRLELLSQIELTHPFELLFRGDLLLVADRNDEAEKDAIESLLVTSGRLVRHRQLINSNVGVVVDTWCIVGDYLVVSDEDSTDLLIYAFE